MAHHLVVGSSRLLLWPLIAKVVSMVADQPDVWLVALGILSIGTSVALSLKNRHMWLNRSGFGCLHLVHHHSRRPGFWTNHHRHCCRHRYLVGGLACANHDMTDGSSLSGSVPEQTVSREEHGNAPRVCFVDDFLVSNGAAWLYDGGRTGIGSLFQSVLEREEGVGC